MELTYPWVLYIGIPLLVVFIVILFLLKKKEKYKTGKKIANTQYAKNNPYYSKILTKYKVLTALLNIFCIFCIAISLVTLARPAKVETAESRLNNRDIFLCLDVSTSVIELDDNLIKEIKETVKNLKGERIGVSIFNTSSNLLVPLTDDYEYVLEVLDKLDESLAAYSSTDLDSFTLTQYSQAGTLVGNETRGSSIIGDGLASCIYSFPNLEEEKRTRVIIFSTDNDDASFGGPIVSLKEGGQIAKDNGIKVYALCPDAAGEEDKEELKEVAETTGGQFYIGEDKQAVSEIVSKIESLQKTEVQGTKEVKRTDQPQIPVILLIISIGILFIINKRVKL